MPPLVAQASRGVFDHRSAKREGGDSVKADKHSSSHTYKEVTMAKRVLLVAIIVAAILVVAAPAMAFNGYRGDYDPSSLCAVCHTDTPGIPQVYTAWSQTAHGVDSEAVSASQSLPNGSVCAGCHTANLDPSKVVPTPTATSSSGAVSWAAANGLPAPGATTDAAATEADIGCSSCHYNKTAAHTGTPVNPSNLANAAICGQCHSRYAYTVDTYTIAPVPYVKIVSGTPVPNPTPITLIQPQMAIGYETMGNAANGWTPAALSTKLNVATPGWTPTPNPSATTAAGLMTYWQINGVDTVWQNKGHDGSASQYPEWAGSKHANALVDLKAAVGPNPPATCLQCHSADYRIAPDTAKPTGAQAKYGITCVGCHTPHDKGTAKGVWDEAFTPQLITDGQKTLCVTCHTAQLNGKVAAAGTTVHNPQNEIMNGTGAIDVPQGAPGVHKGKCVQCHMPPTSISRGSVQLGGNHTWKIIQPAVAADVTPIPLSTPSTGPVVMTTMPYSACSTCHSRPGDQDATWLQDTLTHRQTAMHAWNDQVTAALTKAAKRLGYKTTAAANTAINKIKPSKWSKGQKAFQKSFTNQTYIVGEGSWGIHNWDYARTVVLTALAEAQSVKTAPKPWVITFKLSKARVAVDHKVKFSGTVKTSAMAPGTGLVTIQKKVSGHWKAWRTAKLNSKGGFAKTVKMTKKGTFYFRAFMPRHASNLKKASKSHRLVVM
jgi:Cytochrome c552/Cytochrome c554 and c-prime